MHYGRWLLRALVIAAICLAGFLLYRTLNRYSFEEVVASIRSIPPMRLLASFAFAGCSYLCLTFFDVLGIRYAGKRLPYGKAALASFVSLSIGHNIGVAALSSGAIRYRFYSKWGLDAEDVAKVILFSGMTVALGLLTLGGLGMLLNSAAAAQMTGFSVQSVRGLGVACLAVASAYLFLSAFLRSTLELGRWRVEMPSLRLASAQVLIGSVNFALVAACLHQTLAPFTDAGYLAVSSAYVIANTTALVSHVPGGLGVLETAILYLISGGSLIGALVAFRFVYFFVPLGFGLTLLLFSEGQFLRKSEQHKKNAGLTACRPRPAPPKI
ncbi:MAG TPA: UPF0104 family protein [Rhizobiaceae bacterium]|nr:UPF0104 family protein [Rhizobiaceae bacterium]